MADKKNDSVIQKVLSKRQQFSDDEHDNNDIKNTLTEDNKFCYLSISIAGLPPETVVIELFDSVVPQTCHNFKLFCSYHDDEDSSKTTATTTTTLQNPQPTYRGTEFHRIIPNFMVQGGDFTKFDGSGGHAHPQLKMKTTQSQNNNSNKTFPDESFTISHDTEGIVSMANKSAPHTNGSQFFITLKPTLHLNKKHVAFGKVIVGMDVIHRMAQVETDPQTNRPIRLQRIQIVDCGIGKRRITKVDDDDDDDRSSSSSSSSSRDKRRKHKKKKHKKSSSHDKKKKIKKEKRKKKKEEHYRKRSRHYDIDSDGYSSSSSLSLKDKELGCESSSKKKEHKRRRRRRHHDRRRKSSENDSKDSFASSSDDYDDDSWRNHRQQRRKKRKKYSHS